MDSDTGTRVVFWEVFFFFWGGYLSPSSCLLCRHYLIPKSRDRQGSPDPFQLWGT